MTSYIILFCGLCGTLCALISFDRRLVDEPAEEEDENSSEKIANSRTR